MDEHTQEHEFGWVFFYQSKRYISSRDYRYALCGNAPLIFERCSGRILATGTAYSQKYYLENYIRTGDPGGSAGTLGCRVQLKRCNRSNQKLFAIQAVRYSESGMDFFEAERLVEECISGLKPVIDCGSGWAAWCLVRELEENGFDAERLWE